MAKYIIAATRLNDDGSIHSESHPIEVDSDTINIIKIFDKTYIQEKHGKWIFTPTTGRYRCSACEKEDKIIPWGRPPFDYCPNCGAKMNEVEE